MYLEKIETFQQKKMDDVLSLKKEKKLIKKKKILLEKALLKKNIENRVEMQL